jgi:hypothetical protein
MSDSQLKIAALIAETLASDPATVRRVVYQAAQPVRLRRTR